jgi:hypothetical protein
MGEVVIRDILDLFSLQLFTHLNRTEQKNQIIIIERSKVNIDNVFDDCPICYEDFLKVFLDDEYVIGFECKHYFHKECIFKWLETHTTCPICRISKVKIISCPEHT